MLYYIFERSDILAEALSIAIFFSKTFLIIKVKMFFFWTRKVCAKHTCTICEYSIVGI